MRLTLQDLRHHALASSLFPRTTLGRAIGRLGFVQADPIRSPARAQDLILRHRAVDYHVGDLERSYRALRLEEDYLYAYGFMPSATYRLLHPRSSGELTPAEARVLELVPSRGRLHPRELEAHLGREREVNAWGGYSKTTTRILEKLHYLGLIRVAGRESGLKLYERAAAAPAAPAPLEPLGPHSLEPEERLRALVLRIASLLAPVPESSLRATLQHLRRAAPHLPGHKGVIAALRDRGDLTGAEVEGVRYLWPAGRLRRRAPQDVVRILAPFDPVVWDRRRFEHFWGWPYRFEAYTPPAKRKLGYYALPLLWKADIIGWVNVTRRGEAVEVVPGFVKGRPTDPAFRHAFDAEETRLRAFLAPRAS